ncbi:hypothetical protein [Nitrobacter sp.]|uniref:hypothetical protein n=1 Tax=Nitrobacter sp. TaxID=29420 RepID=UPI00399D6B39
MTLDIEDNLSIFGNTTGAKSLIGGWLVFGMLVTLSCENVRRQRQTPWNKITSGPFFFATRGEQHEQYEPYGGLG